MHAYLVLSLLFSLSTIRTPQMRLPYRCSVCDGSRKPNKCPCRDGPIFRIRDSMQARVYSRHSRSPALVLGVSVEQMEQRKGDVYL